MRIIKGSYVTSSCNGNIYPCWIPGEIMRSLFSKEDLPKSKPKVLMHVIDAGSAGVHVECSKCDNNFWVEEHKYTVTQFKKGIPCAKCNGTSKAWDDFKEWQEKNRCH